MNGNEGSARMRERLRGKRVIVLGGSSGIGYAVAAQAVEEGADVVIASKSAERVARAASELGGRVEGRTLDLFDERAIEAFFGETGAFDHLAFTAGDTLQLTDLRTADLQKARQAFDVRYWATLAAARYAAPHLREGGSMVLTSGISAHRPAKGWVLGASVCGAVDALTRALAIEFAPLRVNAVSPGLVATNLWQTMSEQDRRGMYESAAKALPAGHVGHAGDVAAAYLFLMKSAFATGQIHVVDGGALIA
ncbi:NAD(P)-dependent dehydrogenase (short-subunit alcohol dehydrogenase family) [Paraburkholderia sp. BL8N3]|jgi:NAD(P)-dependent dehydrogenase (short-subunit alcohol dehydrogenase family)|nr:SDR family oxidoreductase [Paraburkholderia sp. BL8N3]TCK34602.1 NAD(P)-dependent dehydrogenase (short-subunit alcohol dehydrogenase family) [Paraburkholderia sp. BL8N3]